MIERRSALATHPKIVCLLKSQTASVNEAKVVFSERRAMTVLQVSAFASTVTLAQAALGLSLALRAPECGWFTGTAARSLRSVGPGVWLIVASAAGLPDISLLRAQLGSHGTVVDLSHARCIMELRGAAASRTLAKYCGLDLDVTVFPTGSATNTRFGHIGMHLARTDDEPTFELLVFRGYAEFVFDALCGAAAEYGYEVQS